MVAQLTEVSRQSPAGGSACARSKEASMRRSAAIAMIVPRLRGLSSAERRMKICLSAILLLISTSALAATSVGHGEGGWFTEFDPIVKRHNRTGELFRIEGRCQSACTLFLAIRNVCIDPAARLLFHAGHDENNRISASATR